MTITRIQCQVRDSAGSLFNGKLIITLDGVLTHLKEGAELIDSLLFPLPSEIIISSGELDILLYESATDRITYFFQFYKQTATTPEIAYSEETAWELRAIVPASSQPISLLDLTQTSLRIRDGDSSLYTVTSRLISNQLFWDNANVKLFPDKGDWNPDVVYKVGDVVRYLGAQYRYYNQAPTARQQPTISNSLNSDYWRTFGGSKGDSGTGVTGEDDVYNASTWNGVLTPPSKNAVRDIIEQLSRSTDLLPKANINNPTFTGSVTIPTPPLNDNSTLAVNSAFCRDNFAPIVSPNFTGSPTAPNPVLTSNSQALATTSFVKSSFLHFEVSTTNNILLDNVTFTSIGIISFTQDGSLRFVNLGINIKAQNDGVYNSSLIYRIRHNDTGLEGIEYVVPLVTSNPNTNPTENGGLYKNVNSSSSSLIVPVSLTPGAASYILEARKGENSTSSSNVYISSSHFSALFFR